MRNLPLNSIRRFVNNGRILRIAGTLLAAVIICSCEEYPEPYATGAGFYPRAAPAGWWHDEGASGSPKIVVHIGEQKAYFYKGKTLVGWTTVSTGKPGFGTPPGHYTVLSKDVDHVSTAFGDYVDDQGNVVRSNIDARKDSRPKGTHFDGARMPYAMFFRSGYAMHQGYVPPFAASHGCIRIPKGMASQFFEHAPVGTPVTVTE
jgi:lipoprotein-anchoring transpeptidase ErfK/SrfK